MQKNHKCDLVGSVGSRNIDCEIQPEKGMHFFCFLGSQLHFKKSKQNGIGGCGCICHLLHKEGKDGCTQALGT